MKSEMANSPYIELVTCNKKLNLGKTIEKWLVCMCESCDLRKEQIVMKGIHES